MPVNWIFRSRKSSLIRPRTFWGWVTAGSSLPGSICMTSVSNKYGKHSALSSCLRIRTSASIQLMMVVTVCIASASSFREGRLRRKRSFQTSQYSPKSFGQGLRISSAHVIQRVPVGIWYVLQPSRVSHLRTLGLKSILYSYTDPWRSVAAGSWFCSAFVGGRSVNVQGPTAPKVS